MSQAAQMTTWTRVQLKMMPRCWLIPSHFMMLLPGLVAVNAANTTRVFPRMQEMQFENVMLKAVWRNIQDHDVGFPMKIREHRKHRVSANRMKKLSSELFTRTMAVFLWWKKTAKTAKVRQAPRTDITVRTMPKVSKVKYSTFLGMQAVLSSFDQKSSGQNVHSIESKAKKIKKKVC